MKKVVLIPDSFKGSMNSAEICAIMAGQILKNYPDIEVISIPVADGGEGSIDCFLSALAGTKVHLQVNNPLFEKMQSFYGMIDNGKTAIVEMAACAGLPLIEDRKNPFLSTTYGVGEIILDAAKKGAKKIIVGLGGSATNDGGCGAAAAVGIRFLDRDGNSLIPTGGTLENVNHIDVSGRNRLLDDIEFVTMCDIDNPMYGPSGASYVFGPQKGATPEMAEKLDRGVKHLNKIIARDLNMDLAQVPGSGAAGAMGAGMIAFFGSSLQMGIETVLDTVRFEEVIRGADMIFTGEGKIDSQSLRGKVVIGVARRAKKHGVPVIAIVGDIGDDIDAAYDEGVSAIFSINRVAVDFHIARSRSHSDLALTMDSLMRYGKLLK